MNPLSTFPLGFTFSPTDEELLTYYLYPKIVGQHNPHCMLLLPVIDLYTQEPSLIWQQLEGIEGQDIYFFTTLKKKKSRIVRQVGSNGNTWSGENKAIKVFSSANATLLGTVKRFHFENPKLKVKDPDCSWIMNEYTLHPALAPTGIVHDSYVLCKIRKKGVKKQNWIVPATTRQYDQNPDLVEVVHELENHSSINMDLSARREMELNDQNPKRRKMAPVDSEDQFCSPIEWIGDGEPSQGNDLENMNLGFSEDEIRELLQPLIDNKQFEMGPTTQMESNEDFATELETMIECNNATPANECPTTQRNSHEDPTLDEIYAEDLERMLECNTVEVANVEKASNYDNEWYWS